MTISILGIDIDKNSYSIVGVDSKGVVIVRRTMRRQTLIEFVSKMLRYIIATLASRPEELCPILSASRCGGCGIVIINNFPHCRRRRKAFAAVASP